jgi:hypothetical protein
VLEVVFILLEPLSPSIRIFIDSHSLPLSGSLFWSFKDDDSSKQEKSGSECQQEDEKDEDKECYDEILGEEELLALFSTTYVGSLS